VPTTGDAARSARLTNRPVPKLTTSTVLAASSTSVLRWMRACDREPCTAWVKGPDHHRSGHEDADLVGAEEPAYNERLNNCGSLGNDQADRGQRRSALEHTAQAGRSLGHGSSSRGARGPTHSGRVPRSMPRHGGLP
jgi:hypothetical protein